MKCTPKMIDTKKIATILSYLFSPVMIAFYALLILSVYPPFQFETISLSHFFIAIFFLCIFPMIAILYYHNKGTIDIWVSNKKQRTPFYIIAILGYLLSSIIFYQQQDIIFYLFSLAYFSVALSLLISNFITKISSHSAGIAGPVTALVIMYGIIGLPLYLILIPIIWARLKLQSHTPLQLLFGILLSIIVTTIVYILLSPIQLATL